MQSIQTDKASFRDPSGYIFYYRNVIYRAIQKEYGHHYTCLMQSGLYDSLVAKNLLISHTEVSLDISLSIKPYKIIAPEKITYISYPYEWCFNQLKDAAITTLLCQKEALTYGMTLKDASAYNIQFHNGRAVLIDTLSFEKHQDGNPWLAYGQFCRHFLAPLLLMKYVSLDSNGLLKNYIDGIPLDLTPKLLPAKTKFNLSILSHIHWHAASQKRYQNVQKKVQLKKLPTKHLRPFIDSLLYLIKNLSLNSSLESTWANYYDYTNYSEKALTSKKNIIEKWGASISPLKVCDWGANNGYFSRIFSEKGIETLAIDNDPLAVNANYLYKKKDNTSVLLPLLADITNPSPAIGWASEERMSLLSRTQSDLCLALALLHHLHITYQIGFEQIADFFHAQTTYLIIEFIPKSDSQVQKLLLNRPDIFDKYDISHFEEAFSQYFELLNSEHIEDSARVMYFFRKL